MSISTGLIFWILEVFCAVKAVITDVPYTPKTVNVFKSACIPAPPEESEPAIDKAIDTFFFFLVGKEFLLISSLFKLLYITKKLDAIENVVHELKYILDKNI